MINYNITENLDYIFNLIAATSRQVSLRNPDYVLNVRRLDINALEFEVLDIRTGNRMRYAISPFELNNKAERLNNIAERISMDICNDLNHKRIYT